MSQVNKYVNPGATGANNGDPGNDAWQSLNTAESNTQDLVTATDNWIIECAGTEDTTAVSWNGWNLSEPYDLLIRVPSGTKHGGVWNTLVYHLYVEDATAIQIHDDFMSFEGLQFGTHTPTANGKSSFSIGSPGSGTIFYIENCIFRGNADATYWSYNVYLGSTVSDIYMSNCLIFNNTGNTSNIGLRNSSNIGYFYNITIVEAQIGFRQIAGTAHCINVLITDTSGNCFLESAGILNCDYCASDDLTADDQGGTGNIISVSVSYVGGDDFHLVAGDTDVIDVGTNLSGDGNYPISIDIDYVTRSGTWDIGADEYVAAGGVKMMPMEIFAANGGIV